MKASHQISGGVAHKLPQDLHDILLTDKNLLVSWEDITPLARNEWICWVKDAKKEETRARRLKKLVHDLLSGKRRPCCWPGCQHR